MHPRRAAVEERKRVSMYRFWLPSSKEADGRQVLDTEWHTYPRNALPHSTKGVVPLTAPAAVELDPKPLGKSVGCWIAPLVLGGNQWGEHPTTATTVAGCWDGFLNTTWYTSPRLTTLPPKQHADAMGK